MPIPTPTPDEERGAFIGRCTADNTMESDFPDNEQRMAVCQKAYREGTKVNEAKKDGHELDAEIFAVGKWNGMEFTKEDLEELAETFKILGERHRVPLKVGHNDEQPMTDGQLALGWVEDVWVAGDKLMARFVAMPTVVYNAIQQKRFRNVSIELDIDVDHRGESFRFVLSGVALLGADIPAVNTLADLQTYLNSRDTFTARERICFTVIEGDEMGTETGNQETDRATLEADLQKAKDEAAKFKRELDDSKKEAEKQEFQRKREDMTSRLESLVEAKRIIPATRDKFTKQLKEDDEVEFDKVEFAVAALEEAGGEINLASHGKDTASQGASDDQDDTKRDPDEVIAEKAHQFARENKMSYRDAVFAVMRENPKLAERYRDTGIEHMKG